MSQALMPQDGMSALMHAAINGHTEVAALLIERGADIQAKNKVRSPSFLVAVLFVYRFESACRFRLILFAFLVFIFSFKSLIKIKMFDFGFFSFHIYFFVLLFTSIVYPLFTSCLLLVFNPFSQCPFLSSYSHIDI